MVSIEPYYDDGQITVYLGDCLAVLGEMSDRCAVDLVLTDPPYNVRSEDIALEGRSPMARDFGEWDEDWHPLPSLCAWAQIVRPGGSVLAFTSDRLISEYRVGPFKPRGTVVWQKDNPAPHPRPAYVQATEFIVWLQQEGAAATWNAGGYTLNVEHDSSPSGAERTEHPTQKPLGLTKRLMLRHSNEGDLVLDPFAGSLTTAVAAKHLGRRCIAIEREEKYIIAGLERLRQGVLL